MGLIYNDASIKSVNTESYKYASWRVVKPFVPYVILGSGVLTRLREVGKILGIPPPNIFTKN